MGNQPTVTEISQWWVGFGTGLMYGGIGAFFVNTDTSSNLVIFGIFAALGLLCRMVGSALLRRFSAKIQ